MSLMFDHPPQILTGFHAALQQGRSQAKHMVIAAVDKPPAHYVSSLAEPQQPAPAAHVVDLYSDPYGWLASEASGSSSSSSSEPLPLDQLQRMLLQERDGQAGDAPAAAPSTPAASVASGSGGSSSSSAGPELCIVLDSLSTLLLRYHHLQVLLLLRALASSPRVSCVLALLHQDLHQARELAALQHAACCLARLTPVGELEAQMAARQGGRHPIGAVEFRWALVGAAACCLSGCSGWTSAAVLQLAVLVLSLALAYLITTLLASHIHVASAGAA